MAMAWSDAVDSHRSPGPSTRARRRRAWARRSSARPLTNKCGRSSCGSAATAGRRHVGVAARVLVNCGGLYADAVDDAARGPLTFAVAPRRGDCVILDARGPLASLGALARPSACRSANWDERLRVAHGPRRRDRRAHGRALLGGTVPADDPLQKPKRPGASGKTGARRLELRRDSRPLRRLRPGARDQSDYIIRRDGARHCGGHPVDSLTASWPSASRRWRWSRRCCPAARCPRCGAALPSLDELRASYGAIRVRARCPSPASASRSLTRRQHGLSRRRAECAAAPASRQRRGGGPGTRGRVAGPRADGVERIVGGRTNDMFRVVDDEGVSVLVRVYGGGGPRHRPGAGGGDV